MDIGKLKMLTPDSWGTDGAVLYGSRELISEMDEKVLEQITNVASLPGLAGKAMTMPDAHWGYGFPIGGVAAFDAEEGGIISAGGVGFDISCGIRCMRTNLHFEDIESHMKPLAESLFRNIPAGVGEQGSIMLSVHELGKVMREGAQWAVESGYGEKGDLHYVEEKGKIAGALPECVSAHAKNRQLGEMGTLGSGNHYLEIQIVDEIFDTDAAKAYGLEIGKALVSIHCGSRGLGHQIGTDYLL
ncbi:MAG TPA: RtcB family protein, partial [Burkholderiales bacterium]|nr:RtcB family protein [Burkholderiales bacterium]